MMLISFEVSNTFLLISCATGTIGYKSKQFQRVLGTKKKAPTVSSGAFPLSLVGDYFFFESASILSFNACSCALASPKVGAASSEEEDLFLAALTLFSSCSLKIAVWLATTRLKSLLNSIDRKSVV